MAQSGFEKPLRPSREKVGIINGFGCFPEKVSPPKDTDTFIPGDFEHEIATNFVGHPHQRKAFIADRGRDPGEADNEWDECAVRASGEPPHIRVAPFTIQEPFKL
jgi:hypothetical protein